MLAKDIQAKDELQDAEGNVAYAVTSVERHGDLVVAGVRYRDGGNGWREFDAGTDVPLTRPGAEPERPSYDVHVVPARATRVLPLTGADIAEQYGGDFAADDVNRLYLALVDDATRAVWVFQGSRGDMRDLIARVRSNGTATGGAGE